MTNSAHEPETDLTPDEAKGDARAKRVSERWPLFSGIVAVLLVAGLGAIVAYRDGNLPFGFDREFLAEMVEHRSTFWTVPALVMNTIGAGILGVFVIPLVIIAILLIAKRRWAALFFASATIVSASLVQILKHLYERPRPGEILVTADLGSFPSGHTANAATMAVVLSIILQRTWVKVAGVVYTVIMLLSRTYLGAHWLSDTLGGLVLGAGVALALWAPFAARIRAERRHRRRARSKARATSVQV